MPPVANPEMESRGRTTSQKMMAVYSDIFKPRKVSNPTSNSKLQQLNNLLSSEETRLRGMILMVSEIPGLSKEMFVQNCIKWMHVCCNVDDFSDSLLALKNLEVLIEESSAYPELNSNVSNFLRTKFFPQFFKYFVFIEEGWRCVQLCLTHYKGSCNAYQERLKQAAKLEIEKGILAASVAHVFAFLPMLGESGNEGINYMNKWKNQFEEILMICYSILQDLFKDVVEAQMYNDKLYQTYSNLETMDEKLLYKFFHNYCSILQSMLLSSFPVPKSIMPQKIFDVICRCLNVTSKTLGNLDTTKKIRLSNTLPQFHVVANSLLKALIVMCKTQLLPYSYLISKLMNQTIQSTDSGVHSDGWDGCLFRLRISTYDTWRTWAIASNGAGAVQSEILALAALRDISVNVQKQEASTEVEVPVQETETLKHSKINESLQKSLCISALKVLQVYIREVGAKLQADQLKVIQMNVTKNILKVQLSRPNDTPYSSWKCRYELYALLMELVNCQCSTWGSPVNWGLELFRQGIYDSSHEVSNFCSSALANVQNIVDQEVIRVAPVEEAGMQID